VKVEVSTLEIRKLTEFNVSSTMNIENVDPSTNHEAFQCRSPVSESKSTERTILSPKSSTSENINPNIDIAANKTSVLDSVPQKTQGGKSRPPRNKTSRVPKASQIPVPSRYNASSTRSRRRSSSTSSLQRLTDQQYYDKCSTSSDDVSVSSTGSSYSHQSGRRQSRSSSSTGQPRRAASKDININGKRGRSTNRFSYKAPSTPTGRNVDDVIAGSIGSSSSFRNGNSTRQTRSGSSTRQNGRAVPNNGGPRKTSSRFCNSAPSTPTHRSLHATRSKFEKDSGMQVKAESMTKYNWTEQQRRAKEERDKRRLQQPITNPDILLQELNRSYNRPGTGESIASQERPNKICKKTSAADCEGTIQECEDTLATMHDLSCSKRKKSFTAVSTIKKMASGFYTSPRKSASQKTGGEKISPMSYSKAVKMGGTPQFIRKLFDEKSRDMLKELCGVDVNTSESNKLAGQIFAVGTGISDEEIKRILNAKASIANKWELKKQLEDRNITVKNLKATLNLLMKGKNKHLTSAIEAEKMTKRSYARAIRVAKEYDGERQQLKDSVKEREIESATMTEEAKDRMRELNSSEEKVSILGVELAALKTKNEQCMREQTKSCIALEVEKARCQEAEKQIEGLQQELLSTEACKVEAVNQAKAFITTSVERDKDELREEVASLVSKIETQEEEFGRLIGKKETRAQINDVKEEMDRLRNQVQNLESHLTLREAELSRAVVDGESAKESAASKDIALRDLMKGLSDIQKSSQAREDEANSLRKEAENKSSDSEIALADVKGKNAFLTHEKATLEESMKTTEKELKEGDELICTLKKDVDTLKQNMNSSTSQLQLEKELRAQSCQKEREERNERIALSAQMVAMTKEHAEVEVMLKESSASTIRQYEDKIDRKQIIYTEKEIELSDLQEGIARLEAEILSLKQALNDEKTMAQAKSAEVISGLKGEINMLKERMRSAVQKSLSAGAASAEQVKALEDEISECHAERRRMHNLVQELRGNVRVFARVRPFLPGDCADDDAQPCVVPNGENTMQLVSKTCYAIANYVIVHTLTYYLKFSSVLLSWLEISYNLTRLPSTVSSRQVLVKTLYSLRSQSLFNLLLMDIMYAFFRMDRQVVGKHTQCKVVEAVRCEELFLVPLNKLVNIRKS